MKENSIKFELTTKDNKTVEISAEIEMDNTLTRMGKPVLCNCTGNTVDTATPFQYSNGVVKCPVCGKESTKVTTFDDYEDHELANIHLKYFGTDYITMQDLYKLSYTLPYEKWSIVEDCFMKLTPEMVDLGNFDPNFVGWVTSNPEEVENRLNVKKELRVGYHKQVEQERIKEEQKNKHKIQQILEEILEEFSIVETPESADGMFTVEGEVIDNPLNPLNEYGGGEHFIINLEYIWYIRNNSRDTDNHAFNNINIKGSYGAIGKRIPYDQNLVDKIKSLKS